MNHTPEIKEFIKKHSSLFWYTPEDKKEEISLELLVETIFNYGDLAAVRKLFLLLGEKKLAKVFFDSLKVSNRRSNNYNELAQNYFTLMLRNYAS